MNLKKSEIWSAYCIFGMTLLTNFSFVSRLAPGPSSGESRAQTKSPAQLSFTCSTEPPIPMDCAKQAGCEVFSYDGIADFYCFSDRIVCHLLNPACIDLIEIYFLGEVLSFWLERQGIPALHAAAVCVEGRAIAFLSSNQGGKSGLAAGLMQLSYPLLTDDILPVEENDGVFWGRPGYPTMRMWPDEAEHFLGSYEHLPLVHPELTKLRVFVGPDAFGSFCETSQPLACIYLPERREASDPSMSIEILPVSPRDVIIELIRHSFSAHLAEGAGLAPQRLDFFARLVKQVPLRRLIYPSGFEHLPAVREAILENLQKKSDE